MFQTRTSKSYLLLEMLGIFVILPLLIFFWTPHPLLPLLWLLALICLTLLLRDKSFDKSKLWTVHRVLSYQALSLQLISVTLIAAILLYLINPDLLFSLIKENPILWLLVMIFYPILSVYPQELIYRSFFFHRYKPIITDQKIFIVINALLFGYMHIIFHNWVAVVLTTLGGLYFAYLYQRSHSVVFVSIVHALYGNLIFTIGMGQYFYHGSIQTIAHTFKF